MKLNTWTHQMFTRNFFLFQRDSLYMTLVLILCVSFMISQLWISVIYADYLYMVSDC